MRGRKEKVEELMEGFMSLKHRAMLSARGRKAEGPRITPSQWGIVMYIRAHAPCTVKELANAFSITSSAATQLIDGLVKSGYVQRKADSRDRRAVQLTLSKKTHTQLEQMKRQAIRQFLQLFRVLSDREFDQYCLLNKKIVRGFSHS